MKIENFFPAISWLRGYKSSYFYFDFIAGINLGVSMIPKAMAYALVAGLPPIYGLYASFVAPIVAILFGSNRLLFTGPVGVMTVLVFIALKPLAEPGSPEYIGLAALLSLLVGVIIFLVALLRLTFMLNLISHAAVLGFVNAAAIIIIATQLKYVFGFHIPDEEFMIMIFVDILTRLPETNIIVLSLSIIAFISISAIHKFYKKIPETLIVVVGLSLVVFILNLETRGVELVGSLPRGLPLPSLPPFEMTHITALLSAAVIIAIVGMTETYSISKIVSYNTKQKVDYHQEFIGQGLSNLVTSFFHGYPVCGSFSGTSVNWTSGARTGVSIIIFSFMALLSITVITPIFYYLPKFILSIIVIIAVLKLLKPKELFEIYRLNRSDGIVAIVTFSVALITKPDNGIIVGIVLALALYVWNTMNTPVFIETKDKKTGYFIAHKDLGPSGCDQILILKPEGPFVYVNAEHLRDEVIKIVSKHKDTRSLILDMGAVYYVDTSGIEVFSDLIENLEKKNIKILLVNLDEGPLKSLELAGLTKHIDIYETKKEAISSAMKKIDRNICDKCTNDLFIECKSSEVK